MNIFCEHHQNSINFSYRCFDRILLNGLIQPFQQPQRVIGFFNAYREGQRVTRNCLRDIAEQFQNWGQEPLPGSGVRPFWMRRTEGVITLSILTSSTPKPIR